METYLCNEPKDILLINILLVCDVLYNLRRTHQLLCFCIWDLKTWAENSNSYNGMQHRLIL